jgi:formamidopyrimidine-DNA glycosylase
MPELPEVETVARQLAPLIETACIVSVRLFDPKLTLPRKRTLKGRRIARVFRSGKQVVLELVSDDGLAPSVWLAVHLRMTGRLIFRESGEIAGSAMNASFARKHLRASFLLDRGRLLFYDVRRFGTLKLFDTLREVEPAGMDPLERRCTARTLGAMLARANQEIKPWLLRQDRLVGLGNIYASEILYAARLHPRRKAAELSGGETEQLTKETKRILRKAIRFCGTTFSDFQDARGQSGGFVKYLEVYGKQDEPCRRCGTPIEKIVQQGRSTFFCPSCQTL